MQQTENLPRLNFWFQSVPQTPLGHDGGEVLKFLAAERCGPWFVDLLSAVVCFVFLRGFLTTQKII